MPSFKIITLGCKVNQYESSYLDERLLECGWRREEKGPADLVIINTCIVTQKASHQSRQQIRKAIRENPGAKIVVTGCYAQVYPEELKKIDGIVIVGNKGKEKIPELIKNDIKIYVQQFSEKELFSSMPVSQFWGKSRAFLKIQDGCESFCSYCIIPFARGPYRSMNIKEVLRKIEDLMDKGYKEVVLTGIHLGKYGIDQGTDLVFLLNEIKKQKYPLRIRLSSIEPNEISESLLDMIAQEDWICRHLHIPLQSGDNRILKAMNRKYRREDFYKLIMSIYDKIPFVSIGTDVMTGFPGEDLSAHKNTVSFIKDLPISYLHVFPYSDRPNTAAFYFKGKVSPKVIKERAREIRELGRMKKLEFLNRCRGEVFTAVIEYRKEAVSGLTDNYIRVFFEYKGKNSVVDVKIEKIKNESAIGRVVSE